MGNKDLYKILTVLLLIHCAPINALTAVEEAQILNLHNQYRLSKKSSNMENMVWDIDLAVAAQQELDKCVFISGDQDQFNQYYDSTSVDIDTAFSSWTIQGDNYNYDGNLCAGSGMCSSYLQVVQYNSNMIGCAIGRCASFKLPNGKLISSEVLVCKYSKPEMADSSTKPYSKDGGSFCTNCESVWCTVPGTASEGLCNSVCTTSSDNCNCILDATYPAYCVNGELTADCDCACTGGWSGDTCEDCGIAATDCANGGTYDGSNCECTCPAGTGDSLCPAAGYWFKKPNAGKDLFGSNNFVIEPETYLDGPKKVATGAMFIVPNNEFGSPETKFNVPNPSTELQVKGSVTVFMTVLLGLLSGSVKNNYLFGYGDNRLSVLVQQSDGTMTFENSGTFTGNNQINGLLKDCLNKFCKIAILFDFPSSIITVYVNGELKQTLAVDLSSIDTSTPSYLYIGSKASNTQHIRGRIACAQFYQEVLSATQVAGLECISECAEPSLCSNGGDETATCGCDCVAPYTGNTCTDCLFSDTDCANGGSVNTDTCACDCVGLWSGNTCEECDATGCQNSGTMDTSTCTCSCNTGFTGESCDCTVCPGGKTPDNIATFPWVCALVEGTPERQCANDGLSFDATDCVCRNINECDGANKCTQKTGTTEKPQAVCLDLTPKPDDGKDKYYKCKCDGGYEFDEEEQLCVDINECGDDAPSRKRRNTDGTGGGTDGGTDGTSGGTGGGDDDDGVIEVCTPTKTLVEGEEAPTCGNTIGGYDCNCRTGFDNSADENVCVNIDECSTGDHVCNDNTPAADQQASMCSDLLPGDAIDGQTLNLYECTCLDPYKLNTDNICVDRDECDDSPCDGTPDATKEEKSATCQNSVGSFACVCLDDDGNLLASHVYDPDKKVCVLGMCAPPEDDPVNIVSQPEGEFKIEESFEYECKKNYGHTDGINTVTKRIVTCVGDDAWDAPPLECDDCLLSCKNGGTFKEDCTCTCLDGWTGDTCEDVDDSNQDPCESFPCMNGGTPGLYQDSTCVCACPVTHEGPMCETPIINVVNSCVLRFWGRMNAWRRIWNVVSRVLSRGCNNYCNGRSYRCCGGSTAYSFSSVLDYMTPSDLYVVQGYPSQVCDYRGRCSLSCMVYVQPPTTNPLCTSYRRRWRGRYKRETDGDTLPQEVFLEIIEDAEDEIKQELANDGLDGAYQGVEPAQIQERLDSEDFQRSKSTVEETTPAFPTWIIGIIVAGVILLVGIVIIVFVVIYGPRKPRGPRKVKSGYPPSMFNTQEYYYK